MLHRARSGRTTQVARCHSGRRWDRFGSGIVQANIAQAPCHVAGPAAHIRNLFDTSGMVAGSTVIEVGPLFLRGGTIGTTGPVTNVVNVTGSGIVFIRDTQDGRVDGGTTDFMLFMTEHSIGP